MSHAREQDEANPDQVALTRDAVADIMKAMDITMLVTRSDGRAASRPMSNNRDVTHAGTSWFFTLDDKRVARDIMADPAVTLAFMGEGQWLSVQCDARIVTERATMEEHYVPDLDDWFEDGLDTKGLCLIEATAVRATAWGQVSGEVEY